MEATNKDEQVDEELKDLPMYLPVQKQREMFDMIYQQSVRARKRRRWYMTAGNAVGIAAVIALAIGLWNSDFFGTAPTNQPSTISGSDLSHETDRSAQPDTSQPPLHKWELVGKVYPVNATIIKVNQTSDVLKSISIKINKNLPNAGGWEQPFQVGSTIEVRFDEKLTLKGQINPKAGDEIILGVGQYAEAGSQSTFLGSEYKTYYYQKNGKFYDINGNAQE